MPDLHLETAMPRDLNRIVNIDRNAFERPWRRKSFSEELERKDAYSYVVRMPIGDRRTEIIAYAFVRIFLNEMHILRLAVTPDFQTRGVATVLLQQCFKLARQKQVDAAYIEVRPTNKTAICLYQKSGFQSLGTRLNYYPETGEDALVMVRHLKERL